MRKTTRTAEFRAGKGRIRSSEERRRSRDAATAFGTLIDSQDIVGLVVDDTGIVQLVRVLEPARLQTLVAKLKGQSLLDMLDRRTYDLLIDRSLSSCQTGQAAGLECLFNSRGRARWFSVTVRRMRNGAVPSKAFSVFVHNVERRTTIAERLKTSQTLLDHAERLAEIGTWEADLQAGEFTCSQQLFRILHLDQEQTTAATNFLWRVVSRCSEASGPSNRRRQASPVEFEFDYVRPDDDKHRLLLTRTIANGHQSGPALHFIGIVEDITEQRRDETRVRESEALLAQAEELANTGSWEY